MKLADARGYEVLDMMADLVGPMTELATDPAVQAMFERRPAPKGMSAEEFAAKRIKDGAPGIIREHKEAIVQVLATVQGETVEGYLETLSMPKLFADVNDMFSDPNIMGFFSSNATRTGEEPQD